MSHEEIEQVHQDKLAQMTLASPKLSTFEQVKKVHLDKKYARVGGFLVDSVTASVVVRVHASFDDDIRKNFEDLPVRKMVGLALKISEGKGR